MNYYLLTFVNTHTAMAMQTYLKGKLNFCIMPTLREISNSCGISIKIETEQSEKLSDILLSLECRTTFHSALFTLYYINYTTKPLTPVKLSPEMLLA